MKKFRKKIIWDAVLIVLMGGIAFCGIKCGSSLLWSIALATAAYVVFMLCFDIKEYKLYQELNRKIAGQNNPEDIIKTLKGLEEMWLSFADKSEIDEICRQAAAIPEKARSSSLRYFLERAEIYR